MSRPRPTTGGAPRPGNTVVMLREAFLALNDLVIVRLTERGHAAVRPAHGAVFQHLDDTGTTVRIDAALGPDRARELRRDLEMLQRAALGHAAGPA